jgi:hypothetical protein
MSQQETEELEKQLDIVQDTLDIQDKDLRTHNKKLVVVQKYLKAVEEIRGNLSDAESLAMGLADKFVLPDSKVNDFAGTVVNLGEQLKGAWDGGKISAIGFVETFSTNIWGIMLDNMASLVLTLYDAENAFRKATGASKEMARGVTETWKATRDYGVSMEDASAATQALFKITTDFTMMNKEQQQTLATNAAMLQKYGISHQDFAIGVQTSIKALGQNADEAAATGRELNAYAQDIGVIPSEMAANFAKAGDTLAKFGKDGVKAFKDISMVAKLTGMDVDRLLDITAKFDTFEGAADQAGKLNAALGGNFVNAMDLMMETDPTERFKQIRTAISDAGLSFDDMSYYQKNFYKDALGLQSVGELSRALSGDMSMLDKTMEMTSEEFADQAKEAQNLASMQEQWNMLVQQMIPILTPVIDALRWTIETMLEYSGVVKAIIGLAMLYKAAQLAQWAIGKLTAKQTATEIEDTGALAESKTELAIANIKLAASQQISNLKWMIALGLIAGLGYILYEKVWASNFIDGIMKFGKAFDFLSGMLDKALGAFGRNIKGALAMGVAMLLMGTGVAVAAYGVAELARAMGEAGDNAGMAVIAIAVLGATMIGLAVAITAFAVLTGGAGVAAVLAFGAAFLMLGGGVALAALGFKMFIDVAKELTLGTILNLAAGMVVLGLALHVFASPPLLMASLNMVALSLGLMALGEALERLSASDAGMTLMISSFGMFQTIVEAITAPMRILESIFATLGDPDRMMAIGESFGLIAQEIDNIPVAKAVTLTATLGATAVAATAIGVVGGAAAMATGVVETLMGSPGAPGAGGAGGVGGAGGHGNPFAPPEGRARNQELTVNLNLDGKTVDKKVIQIINDKIIRPGWSGGVG